MKKESIVDIWERPDENPHVFAFNFGLTIKELLKTKNETYYLFTGSTENVTKARAAGYFYNESFA